MQYADHLMVSLGRTTQGFNVGSTFLSSCLYGESEISVTPHTPNLPGFMMPLGSRVDLRARKIAMPVSPFSAASQGA